ncbi:MarR family winged helix-turn-helix transcriptional regulator [Streptomyces sp. NPDC020799]|uniref:MarR family winged helix-turn-helix transcriptional regulator n=1 Tax=unclassified Streptomyces TaxID=2593676 RepID=UPI0033E33ED9
MTTGDTEAGGTALAEEQRLSPALMLIGVGRAVREEAGRSLEARGGHSLRLMSALGHLAREPGLSYSELGRRAGVTAQSMQATVLQLERAGAVARSSPAGRGRTAVLRVTEHGRHMLAEMRQTLAELEEPLLAGLSTEERAVLAKALGQVAANLRTAAGPSGNRRTSSEPDRQ